MRGNKNVEKHACQNAVAMESSNCLEKVINIQSQREHFLPQLATLTRVASHWFGSDRVNCISISLLNANLFRTLTSDLAPFFLPQPLNSYRSVTSYCKWATGDPELSNGWRPNVMLDCEQSLYISRVQRDGCNMGAGRHFASPRLARSLQSRRAGFNSFAHSRIKLTRWTDRKGTASSLI